MDKSTPADLVTAFRSLARRQREAIGDADPAALRSFSDELQGHVAEAAAAIGSAPDAAAIAAAIESRRDWDEATLDNLRQAALDAGAVLRRLAAAAEELQ